MKKILISILLVCSILLFSEEDEIITEDIISIDKERSETLLYGIDTEVKELITTLTKEETLGFNDELLTLLQETYDDSIKILILEYFIKMDISDGENEALKIFEKIIFEDEYSTKYAVSALTYLSSIASSEAIKQVPEVLENENEDIVISALKLIGENKVISLEQKLIEMFEDEDTEEQIYLKIIETLGEIQSTIAIDILIPVLDDDDEETTIRNAICYSLGEIGDTKAIPALKRALESRDNYLLRKSALNALGKFDGSDMNQLLIESLRDPNWQIRYTACRSLAERKVKEAFPILRYKALNDPEPKIQKEAFRAIGDINSDECREFLKEVYLKASYSDSARLLAIEKLIEHNVDWIYPSIEKYYEEKSNEKRKPILDATLQYLSKKEYQYSTELFSKMLEHENYIYKLYAIQGIRLNNYSEFKEQLEELSVSDKNKNVKKHALSALEEL